MLNYEISATDDSNLCRDPGHTCQSCSPDQFGAPAERINGLHLAVRFGDDKPRKMVLLNGKDVSLTTFEVYVGERDGWVYAYAEHPPLKGKMVHGCGRAVCAEVRQGTVRLKAG